MPIRVAAALNTSVNTSILQHIGTFQLIIFEQCFIYTETKRLYVQNYKLWI